MRKIYLLILFLSLFKLAGAQFVYISDTSTVYSQIKQFYLEGLNDTVGYRMPLILHENILDSTQMEFGIFIFRPLTSNALQQLYLRNFGSNEIEIIRQYNVEILLGKVFKYFEMNASKMHYSQKLQCIVRLVEMLQMRMQ